MNLSMLIAPNEPQYADSATNFSYGLNWVKTWYRNLLSDNFQIQRNLEIKKGQSPSVKS